MVAILLSGLVPQGYMIDVDNDDRIIIRICSTTNDTRYVVWDPSDDSETSLGTSPAGDHDQEQDDAATVCLTSLFGADLAISHNGQAVELVAQVMASGHRIRAPPIASAATSANRARAPPHFS